MMKRFYESTRLMTHKIR